MHTAPAYQCEGTARSLREDVCHSRFTQEKQAEDKSSGEYPQPYLQWNSEWLTRKEGAWWGRGSYYSVKLNQNVVEQSRSKGSGVYCDVTLWPLGLSSIMKLKLIKTLDLHLHTCYGIAQQRPVREEEAFQEMYISVCVAVMKQCMVEERWSLSYRCMYVCVQ